jgi:TPR repeat protein
MAEADRIWQSGDQAAAARPFLAAARASNSKAQLKIGWHYENGIGVPQSYNEAASWYRKAADQGETSAMANLAYMYEFGKGVPEDWVQSAKWLQTSAAFGDPLGQSRLGDAYQYGIGVPQNRKLAIHWHYEATLRGNGHSASEFARLSKSGTFIGFYNADERALFPAMPTSLIYAEPAGTLFHNSAERMAYIANRVEPGGMVQSYDWVAAEKKAQKDRYEQHKHDTDSRGNPRPCVITSTGETKCP